MAAKPSLRRPGPQFAQDLSVWWLAALRDGRFGRQLDVETKLGIRPGTFGHWMAGEAYPSDPLCERLYSLTELPWFSPEKRAAVRLEYWQERGLSRSGAKKRAERPSVKTDELAECVADPDKAFTIRGDDWIVCLECGLMLKQIRDKGTAAHLREHGISVEQYREGRYGKNRSLICNALAAKLRDAARESGRLVPDRTRTYLRSPEKGRKMPPEWHRSHAEQGRRTAGTRDLDRDTEILRLWLIEQLPIEAIARRTKCSKGYPHKILQRIFGIRVKQRIVFSRGEPVTDLWINRLCERFGLSKLALGELLRLKAGETKWLQQLGATGKNRALTPETAGPLVDGEGLFLEILANGDTLSDRADYLRAVIPDLAEKRDGASLAIGIARGAAELKEVCNQAQTGNWRSRIALAFLQSAAAWLPTLDDKMRASSASDLVRNHFLPMELKTSPSLLREAIERSGPADTKPATIRGIIVTAFHTKELEAKLAARGRKPKKGKPDSIIFGETVTGRLPRFADGMRIYKPGGSSELRKAGYTDLEIDCIRDSRNATTAAIRWACKNFNNHPGKAEIAFKTGKNYFSIFLDSTKRPFSRERPE